MQIDNLSILECVSTSVSTQVNTPGYEGADLAAERVDRKEFLELIKRMLVLDADSRITPGEALGHNFVTLNHLYEYQNTTL